MKEVLYFGGYGDQYWTSIVEPNFNGTGNRVTAMEVDLNGLETKILGEVKDVLSPATLTVSHNKKYIYACNEVSDFAGTRGSGGGVTSFKIKEDGSLEKMNDLLSYGAYPSYVAIDKEDKYLLVINHGSYYCVTKVQETIEGYQVVTEQDDGTLALIKLKEDGSLDKVLDVRKLGGTGADPIMHGTAHPHSVAITDDDFIIVPNKGGDNIYTYKLNRETEKLEIRSVFGTGHGSSPRHIALLLGTPYVYIINEFDANLVAYELDTKNAALREIASYSSIADINVGTDPRPGGNAFWGTDVRITPDGKYLYCNNTQNVLNCFSINKETGKLTKLYDMPFPAAGMTRDMCIDPTGQYLFVAAMAENKVDAYRILEDGKVEYVKSIEAPSPTAVEVILLED